MRFGAILCNDVPVRFVSSGTSGYVPAQVWEVEPDDYKRLETIFSHWSDAGPPYQQTFSDRLRFDAKFLARHHDRVQTLPWPLRKALHLVTRIAHLVERNRTYVITVGGHREGDRMVNGKVAGVIQATRYPFSVELHSLEVPYWNRRDRYANNLQPPPPLNGRFQGLVEALVTTALAQNPGRALYWGTEHNLVQRYYQGLLKRLGALQVQQRSGTLRGYASYFSLSARETATMVKKQLENFRQIPIDPKAEAIAKSLLEKLPDPSPLVPPGETKGTE